MVCGVTAGATVGKRFAQYCSEPCFSLSLWLSDALLSKYERN
jgi:hypothetical protein